MAGIELWDTPGARRWFAAVVAAMERRTVVIMCHPAIAVPVAAPERVAAAAAARRPRIRVLTCPPDLPIALGDGGRNAELLARTVAEHLDRQSTRLNSSH